MAGPSLDANLANVFKIWYTDKSPEDAFFRNSPVVKWIPKTKIGGKSYNLLLTLGNGGSASGNLIVSTTNATNNGSAPNAEFAVTNGQLFGTFFITQQEIMASQNIRGAYMPVAVNRFAQSLDAFRKLTAASLYGTGFGEIGQAAVVTTAIADTNTMTLRDTSVAVKLSIGSVFRVTNGSSPADLLRASVNTVLKINGLVITFRSTAVETWAATDWIEMDGCRTGTVTPLLPVGLGGWLPSLGNRTGGTWDTYIATSFFGVVRNVNVNGAAGQFILRDVGGGEKMVDAIVRGVNAVRIAGGMPDMLVLNSEDYQFIITEMNAQTTLFQSINTGKTPNKNEVAKGISDMKYAFSTSWVDEVWDDPFCPKGIAYILQRDTMEFAALNNSEGPMDDGIEANAPGKEAITDVKAPEMNYYWLIEDYVTSQPGSNTINGPALQVIVQMYGCWVVHNPSECCVIALPRS